MAVTDLATQALRAEQRAEEAAARLPPLLVAADRVASTVAQGVHGRRRVGTGETFWQFRPYELGDASSAIDWRQSAKADRLYVRQTEWEAAQSVWLWRDGSPSMAYRSSRELPTKAERAELMLLALASLLARGGERVALMGTGAPPVAGRTAVSRLAQALVSGAIGESELPMIEVLPRHAQVVIIGDLLAPLDDIHRVVSGLAGRGISGHLVQVLDPAEETLPFDGRVEFRGLEGEASELIPRVEVVRDTYRERLAHHRDGLAALARASGWTLTTHHTDQPPHAALLALYASMAAQPNG